MDLPPNASVATVGEVYNATTAYGILSGCAGTKSIDMAIEYIDNLGVGLWYG